MQFYHQQVIGTETRIRFAVPSWRGDSQKMSFFRERGSIREDIREDRPTKALSALTLRSFQTQKCANRVHCQKARLGESTFLAIFWGIFICQVRLLSRISSMGSLHVINHRFIQVPLAYPLVFAMPLGLSGPLRLRVQSRSRTWLRIAVSIAFLFRACFKGVWDTIAPLSRG